VGAGVLELNGLCRRFGHVIARDNLSFTVPPGQVFGFLGPNGAGKTTAMRAIVGVAAVDSGEVRWNGELIGQAARSRIGYMPEERGSGIALPVRGLVPPPRGLATRITGLAAAILIYVIILTYGIRITIGVGEEKSSRVVEVLLTTLRPTRLLAGKVIGMGSLALAQIAVLLGTYYALGYAVGSSAVRGAAGGVVLAGALWLLLDERAILRTGSRLHVRQVLRSSS